MSMGGILNIFRRLFKYRRHKRSVVQGGTFVVVSPGTNREQKVQLIDISQGGMAFVYEGSPEELEKSGFLKMIGESQPYLENYNYETAFDAPVHGGGDVQSSVPYRRRGVKFKWLGTIQKMELKDYIKKVSIIQE